MKLKKNSWHYKLMNKFYVTHDYSEIYGNNFCGYFWRLMLPLALIGFLCGIAGLLLFLIGFLIYTEPLALFIAFCLVVGILLCSFGIAYIVQSCQTGKWQIPDSVKESARIVNGYAVAKKEQYCPIIEWEE